MRGRKFNHASIVLATCFELHIELAFLVFILSIQHLATKTQKLFFSQFEKQNC
jgi:hypothetical protein